MFGGFLKPKFYSKCKMAIKMTETRLEMIHKRRNAVERCLKKDIVELLKSGIDHNAYGRAGGLLDEQNLSCCYRLVEQFCGSILSNLSVMQRESKCPEESREAVASLMLAAARFADLPELRELRSLFTEKYGTSLENFVNKEFVSRLKAVPPTRDVKLRLMRDVAHEFSLQWDSKDLERKLFITPLMVQGHTKYASPNETRNDSRRLNGEGRDFVPERETEGFRNKLPYIEPKRNEGPHPFHHPKEASDAAVRLNGGSREGKNEQEQEETSHSRKFSYRNIPPPYIKAKPEKDKNIAEENKAHEGEPAQEAKLQLRSVSQRMLKFPAGDGDEQSSRAVKTNDSHNEVDEEERVGGLLMHNSGRQLSPYELSNGLKWSLKPIPLLESSLSCDSNQSRKQKDGKQEFGAPPARSASLPTEATYSTASNETAKMHYRFNSLQNEMFPGHVHPNLPNYDDLASRIAALRGR